MKKFGGRIVVCNPEPTRNASQGHFGQLGKRTVYLRNSSKHDDSSIAPKNEERWWTTHSELFRQNATTLRLPRRTNKHSEIFRQNTTTLRLPRRSEKDGGLHSGCGKINMPLTCVQPGLYIGTRDDAISFCSSKLANCKLRIITVDSEPLVTVEGRDGVVTKYIQCLDEPEADLLSYFDECAEFISGGLESQENVIVHCWAGESRSCAVVLAHLMRMNQMSLDEALGFLKSVHSKVNPNSGFLEQLQLYEAMGNTVNKTSPVYKQYRLQLLASQIQSQQYVTKDLLSSLIDELRNRAVSSQRIFKCRKCRLMLFSADYLIEHEVGHGHDSFKWHKRDSQAKGDSANNDNQCTSLFIEPTDWMLPLLEGSTEGKIPCPKCNGRLGSFNWAGMQCSCGQWVTPAFQFHKNRVDETWNAQPPASNHPS